MKTNMNISDKSLLHVSWDVVFNLCLLQIMIEMIEINSNRVLCNAGYFLER